MKTKNQKRVWNKIAEDWEIHRNKSTKIVEDFLEKKKGKVLDLGCGSGRNFISNKEIEYYGVDFSKEMLKKAKENAEKKEIKYELKLGQAYKIPYPKNFFDAAVYVATLHCLTSKKKREKSIKELYRVLKPGKEALISVWSRNQNRIKNKPKESQIPWTIKGKKQYRYNYIYDIDELLEEINSSNLKFVKIIEDKNMNVIVRKPQKKI